ncbi:phage major capsid protein [Limosilactobacillus fermentum]|uniref:phage major capsid protein n=1 Tax=Limosilactobacillus fermentum TaxID=1613 RepID=UPI0021A6F11A|nr:phage major capsid protein [Limosilactobacillus fermentum]MCT2875127.1 phage major capsid protein [Limosilactobacillus fermentum]
MNFYELKTNVSNIGSALKDANEQLSVLAADPSSTTEDISAQQKKVDALQVRYETLNKQYKEETAKQQAKLKNPKEPAQKSPEERKNHAFAQLVRSTMAKQAVSAEIYQVLGDDSTTGGSKFLPKTVSTNIIAAPEETNPLRDISTITQIPNLEIPRLSFTLDDSDFIQDTATANEMQAKGDTVSFTRNKFKVKVGISETVLLGSDANLTQYIEQGLRNGVTTKERSVAFAADPVSKTAEAHMSFYDKTTVNIKHVTGTDMYEAITQAVADLPESYRENATIVMAYKDYLNIVKELSNGSATLYGAQPSAVLGKPVVFTDAASLPVVGDFSYSHYNYDIDTLYEQDKDVDTGIEKFVVTAWFDHQIKLANAFRIAEVAAKS